MGIRQDSFLDYDGFLDKFKPRKTTDDCYTPPNDADDFENMKGEI